MPATLLSLQAEAYHPHGFCYLWESDLVYAHVVADGLTALAYYSIPVALLYVARTRRDIPFDWMFVAFATFILACGTTHAMAIWNLWHADYWAAAWVKGITAGASVATAALMVPLVPKVLALPSPSILREKNRELEAAHDEIARLNGHLRRRVTQLESANADMRAFSHSVSHDLKAPLRSMEGFASALLEDCQEGLSEQCRDYATRVARGSRRMSALVDDLLAYSQIALGPMSSERVRVDLVVSSVLDSLRSQIEEAGAVVDMDLEVEEIQSRTMLVIVLSNLVSNAIKYRQPTRSPHIVIRTRQFESDTLRISVSDNGIGIAPQHHERIFGIFERLHGVDQYGGTGIGLAIVSKAVARLGGTVSVRSEPGHGSEFVVDVPMPVPA